MEQQKQEQKKVEVIQPKLCPFISGIVVEPVKTSLGQVKIMKTTNVAPCQKEQCIFYNDEKKECKINLFLEGK